MRLDERTYAHPDSVSEAGICLEVTGRASRANSPRSPWTSLYSRLAGCLQLAYSLAFVAFAIYLLGHCYHPEEHGKAADHESYLSLVELFFGAMFALLWFSALVAGSGLVVLDPRVRRWEAVYLGILTVGVIAAAFLMASDIHSGADLFTAPALISLALALPFVPFLFVESGGAIVARPFLALGKKKPVGVSDDESFR
jgi:hypothetical protein